MLAESGQTKEYSTRARWVIWLRKLEDHKNLVLKMKAMLAFSAQYTLDPYASKLKILKKIKKIIKSCEIRIILGFESKNYEKNLN